jgi:hypothetical protein
VRSRWSEEQQNPAPCPGLAFSHSRLIAGSPWWPHTWSVLTKRRSKIYRLLTKFLSRLTKDFGWLQATLLFILRESTPATCALSEAFPGSIETRSVLSYEPRACDETQTRSYTSILNETTLRSSNQKHGESSNSLKVRHATKRNREIKGQDRQRRSLKGTSSLGARDISRD